MGSIKVATSLERGVCSSYTTGKPSPSLLSWSGLHPLTSSCLMGPWVSGSQPHNYKREERSSLSKGPRSQNSVPCFWLGLTWITRCGQEDAMPTLAKPTSGPRSEVTLHTQYGYHGKKWFPPRKMRVVL